jgi:dCTP deaminase
MSVLNGKALRDRIKRDEYNERLMVTPLLSEDQIGPASIDIRLGSSIIIPQKTYAGQQDVTDQENSQQIENRLYERITLRYKTEFILHPNQLILAVTFEYLSLPNDVYGMIMSRSSWGRLGLVVATAASIQPGYKGCITLELVNLSESPIALYPGLPVGQLVFFDVGGKGKDVYQGRYDCPTEAELPKFFTGKRDNELAFWRKD